MAKFLKAFFLIMLCYLLQVCAMDQLKIGDVGGNLCIVCIAVLTVSYGKKYAFVSSCLMGIFLQVMSSGIAGLIAVLYPVAGMLLAQLFADMSDEKREKRRIHSKKTKDMNPHLRIPLDAVCVAALIEGILIIYISISGAELSVSMIVRAVLSVLYTGGLAALLMVPMRLFLHMYGDRIRRAEVAVDEENIDE